MTSAGLGARAVEQRLDRFWADFWAPQRALLLGNGGLMGFSLAMRITVWVAVNVEEDDHRVLGVGSRNDAMERIEREWRKFADRKSRKLLNVPDPVWHRAERNVWVYTEDHDSGIAYGYVRRAPVLSE